MEVQADAMLQQTYSDMHTSSDETMIREFKGDTRVGEEVLVEDEKSEKYYWQSFQTLTMGILCGLVLGSILL
jgi:hypothetical protein